MSTNNNPIAPLMAPLSKPMMLHLANQEKASFPTITTSLDDQLSSTATHFNKLWSNLAQQVEEKREAVYVLMSPVVQGRLLSTEWIIETLTEHTPKKQSSKAKMLTAQTISRWRDQGLLHYEQKNQPDADSTAALLTVRMIDTRERGWLPTIVAENEPQWWCWRQDSPTHPVVPCPVPLPEDLPASALLWTSWRGAAWKREWLPLGDLGAARWAGTMSGQGNIFWSLTEKDLETWDPEIAPLGENVLSTATTLARHTLATLALLRLATSRLEESTTQ